jgi:hypothetical protein
VNETISNRRKPVDEQQLTYALAPRAASAKCLFGESEAIFAAA